jgi:hypothetical protein
MKKTNKAFWMMALLLAVFSITACSKSSTPGTSQGANNNGGGTAKSGELYDIADNQIKAYKVNFEDFTQTAITTESDIQLNIDYDWGDR